MCSVVKDISSNLLECSSQLGNVHLNTKWREHHEPIEMPAPHETDAGGIRPGNWINHWRRMDALGHWTYGTVRYATLHCNTTLILVYGTVRYAMPHYPTRCATLSYATHTYTYIYIYTHREPSCHHILTMFWNCTIHISSYMLWFHASGRTLFSASPMHFSQMTTVCWRPITSKLLL